MLRLDQLLREMRPTLSLAAPIVAGRMAQMLIGVTDSVMIGHAGTVPLAAAAFAGSVFNIFWIVGIGLMVPVSIFVARAHGAQRPGEAAEFLRHGVALAVAFGLGETLLMAALTLRLDLFGQPAEVVAIVTPFFLLYAASTIPVLLTLALRQFAEALGHPWVPMCVTLASVALNAALNWVFIFGNLGSPPLGLTGAGIATLVSRLAGAAAMWWWLKRDPAMHAAWPQSWFGGYSAARIRQMLHIGLPAAGMLLFEATAFAFGGIMIGWLGAVPLAAHQIALSCASLAFMLPLGIAIAVGMRVSHALGAGARERLAPIAFGGIALGFAVMLVFAAIFGVGGRVIAGWFVEDGAVIALAGQLLIVAAFFQLVDGTQVIAASGLRGMSDVKVPAIITLLAYWAVALPLGYGLGIRGTLGAVGMWIGIAGGLTFAAVFLTVRLARRTGASAYR
jgi:multidrug resistance protein, MATE family